MFGRCIDVVGSFTNQSTSMDRYTPTVLLYPLTPPSSSAPVHLPQLLQLVDLLGGDLACTELLLLRGDLHQPGQEAAVLDEGLPLGAVPVDVLQAALAGTWLSVDRAGSRDRQG